MGGPLPIAERHELGDLARGPRGGLRECVPKPLQELEERKVHVGHVVAEQIGTVAGLQGALEIEIFGTRSATKLSARRRASGFWSS